MEGRRTGSLKRVVLPSGQCAKGNPCEHSCFDIRADMFECSCAEGFSLDDDGYSCSKKENGEWAGWAAELFNDVKVDRGHPRW